MSKKFPIAGSVYSYVQRGLNPHAGFISGWMILLDYCIAPALLYTMVANWGVMLVPNSPWWFVDHRVRCIQYLRQHSWRFPHPRHRLRDFRHRDHRRYCVRLPKLQLHLGRRRLASSTWTPFWQPDVVTPTFIAAGISIAALNFLGFDGISTLAEETHEPEKNIGRGIMIALLIIIVCFSVQTYIASLIQPDWMSWDEEHANNAFFYGCQLIGGNLFMNIMLVINIVAVGIANIMNAQLAASRLLYSMGRDGVIPRIFGKVHPKFKTPWVGSIFIGIVAFILVGILGMADLATLVNFGALFGFIMLNFSVFWYFFVKQKERSFGGVVKYLICPWIAIAILVYVFTGFQALTWAMGITWFVIGMIVAAVKSKGFKEVPEAFKNLDV